MPPSSTTVTIAPTSSELVTGCNTPRRTERLSSRSSTSRSEQNSTAGATSRKRRSTPSHMDFGRLALGRAERDQPLLERRNGIAAPGLARHVEIREVLDRPPQSRGGESPRLVDDVPHAMGRHAKERGEARRTGRLAGE